MPVILAFDGGLPGQYHILSSGNTDPNCAVSILESMNADHPDWPLKGAFFINAQDAIDKKAFGEASTSDYKIEHLGADGFDMGCALPPNAGSMPAATERKLLALSISALQLAGKAAASPPLYVPAGQYPKDLDLLKAGSIEITHAIPTPGIPSGHMPPHHPTTSYAQKYTTSCALTDGDKPSASPVSAKFDAYHIPEIEVRSGRTVEELLKSVKDQFISDGDPSTIAVPSAKKAHVDERLIQQDNLQLKTY
jgi:hypothetical protein